MSDATENRPELLDVLSSGPVGVTSPDEVAREKSRMLPWLEEQVAALPTEQWEQRRRERLRRTARWGGVVLAAAAGVAGVFLFRDTPMNDDVSPQARSSSVPAEPTRFGTLVSGELRSASGLHSDGTKLALRGRVETGDVGAALQASQGYQLELGPASALSFETDDSKASASTAESLRLHRGNLKLSVLPRPHGASLQVMTGDVLVTVVKSAFSIESVDGKSCVRVNEGSVTVRRNEANETVQAGGTSGCTKEVDSDGDVASLRTTKKFATPPPTTLTQENALLSRALGAESRGDVAAARRAYRTLLKEYPRSAFAQDARAGLSRLERPIK